MAANFGVKIPEGLIELWQNAFNQDDISLEQIRYAAGKILRSKKDGYGRMPTYAEFIQIIEGSHDDKALVIASEIIAYLRVHGSRIFPKLNDPIAKYLMTNRWPYHEWAANVCTDELKWWTKEFCEAYKSYLTMENIKMPLLDFGKEDIKKLVQNIAQEL